jgi:hypothetical protein
VGFPKSPLFQTIDELPFFDKLAKEYAEKFGTKVRLILFDKEKSTIDPIYDEPTKTVTRVVENLPAIVVELVPISTVEAREEGLKNEKDTTIHFTRAHLEETKDTNGVALGLSDVPEGAIVEVYGSQYDIIQSNREGFLNNVNKWLRVVCTLKRRSEFFPDRRQLP